MHSCLDLYIQTVAQILYRGNLYQERLLKLSLFSLYKVITTTIYN